MSIPSGQIVTKKPWRATLSSVERLRALARTMVTRTARDVTASTGGRSALVLAPHPDDETLGCGAVILRKRSVGTRVVVAIVTDGGHSHDSASIPPAQLAALRKVEMVEAAIRLGIPPEDVRWLGMEDGTVARHEARLTSVIEAMIAEFGPDEVYATSAREPHPDHAAVGRAARSAVTGKTGVALLEYPIWLWGVWPLESGRRLRSVADVFGLAFRRGVVCIRCEGFVDGKLHALQAHHSQLRRPAQVPHTEPWAVLPAPVLARAADRVELFLPVQGETGR